MTVNYTDDSIAVMRMLLYAIHNCIEHCNGDGCCKKHFAQLSTLLPLNEAPILIDRNRSLTSSEL